MNVKLSPGLSGYVCVRNGFKLDYCWELAVQSLLDIGCDEVLICDSDSTDGSREAMDRWAETDSRIRVINYPWPDPRGNNQWWVEWMNFARVHLRYSHQLQLDADEVVEVTPNSKLHVRDMLERPNQYSLVFDRLNFWRDPRHLIPEGHCCGKFVVRMGPTEWWMPSDEPRHPGESEMIDNAVNPYGMGEPAPYIYHLGFLRKKDAFYAKAKVVLHAFFNRYDTRLEDAEKAGKALADSQCDFSNLLVPFNGDFPEAVRKWLEARGYTI